MSRFYQYNGKLIRVTDRLGRQFTGVADTDPPGDGLPEPGRGGESIRLGDSRLLEQDIASIECLPTFEEVQKAVPLGLYRHFKGKMYEVIAIARHSETTEPMVVYRALYGEGGVWVRPAAMWNEEVTRDGRTAKRFARVEEET